MQPAPGPGPYLHSHDAPLRPSGWWYALAAAIGVGGVTVAIVLFVAAVQGLIDKVDDFQRVEVPGQSQVTLEDAGDYTIYHEYEGAYPGQLSEGLYDIELTAPDGSPVELDRYGSDVTYDTGGEEGVALYSFEAEEPGNYSLSVDGPERSSSTVAVGPGIGEGLLTGIGIAIVVGLASAATCAVIAITTGVRRGKERRRRLVAATPNYWPGTSPPSYAAGPAPPGGYSPGSHPPGAPGPDVPGRRPPWEAPEQQPPSYPPPPAPPGFG